MFYLTLHKIWLKNYSHPIKTQINLLMNLNTATFCGVECQNVEKTKSYR